MFLVHLGNFWEEQFNMLSTHTPTPMIYLLFVPIKLSFQNQDWSGIWSWVSPVMLNEGEQSSLISVCAQYCSPICILQPSKECELKAWRRTRKNRNSLGTNWRSADDSLCMEHLLCANWTPHRSLRSDHLTLWGKMAEVWDSKGGETWKGIQLDRNQRSDSLEICE